MQVHGSCQTIVTKFRPVPLAWHFCFALEGRARLLPLFAGKGRSLNSALRPPEPEKFMGVDWGRWEHARGERLM